MVIQLLALMPLLLSPVYPAADDPVRFDHRKHEAVACAQCHPKVRRSLRPGDRLNPSESACVSCHAPFKADGTPDCGRCHPGYTPQLDPGVRDTRKARPWPKLANQEAPALVFGHAPHLARGARCIDCHGLPEAPTLPRMDSCQSCHDGQLASDRCATCHLSHPDGRLKTRLPFGRLRPADHADPGFATGGHGVAGRTPDDCASCHAPTDCQRCHDSRIKPLEIHPADYLIAHPAHARRNDPDCSSCHRRSTFCVECHTLSGVVDQSDTTTFGAGLARKAQFHPPGFTGLSGGPAGPTHHRIAARRNIAECASCHQESTCIKCHSTRSQAALRASPHPPGFRSRCARTLDANDRGCLKCHTSRAELRSRCR